MKLRDVTSIHSKAFKPLDFTVCDAKGTWADGAAFHRLSNLLRPSNTFRGVAGSITCNRPKLGTDIPTTAGGAASMSAC